MAKFYRFHKSNGLWWVVGGKGYVFAGSGLTVRDAWEDALNTFHAYLARQRHE